MEVTSTGFKKAIRPDVEVRVAEPPGRQHLARNRRLRTVGHGEHRDAAADTESASLGTVVDAKRVADLPLSYGNPFLLIGLTAGVTFNGSVRLDRPFEPTHIVNFSMGGTSGNLNDITIDGAPTTATANAFEVTASYVPPTDIVQEFKVQTNTFDAQFGQTQGGVTNISIKSGTNNFHGSVNYSFQRPSFWANDFFLNKAGTPRPDFLFNRWGGSFSGPVRIPKVYNGKNKTFFLFGYEGIHDSRPRHDDTTNTVPTPAMHNGDFSALLNAPQWRAVHHLRPGHPRGDRRRPFPADPVPGQQDPDQPVRQGRHRDPLATTRPPRRRRAMPSAWPTTRTPPPRKRPSTTTTPSRVDQNLGDRQRFFVRYSSYIRNSTYNQYFNNAFVGDQFYFYSKTAAFDHVATLSPTMVLNTRYSYNRFIRGGDQPAEAVGFDLTSLGFSPAVHQPGSQRPGALPAHQPAPAISATGTPTRTARSTTTRWPPRSPNRRARTPSAPASNIASTRKPIEFKSNQQTGQFTFGTTWTRGPLDNSAGVSEQHRTIGGRASARPAGFRQHHPPVGLHRAVRFVGHSSCRTIGRSLRSSR